MPAIFQVGALLSRSQMEGLGISYGMSSWGNPVKEREMRDYICCSILRPWGMSGQDPETRALITLQPRTLCRNGTLFSGRWSSFNEITLEALRREGTDLQAFEIMFPTRDSNFPSPAPGEFLVPDCVPLAEFLPRLYVYSEAARQKVADECRGIILPSGRSVVDYFQVIVSKYDFGG